jgi:hypothetical protein
MKTRYDNIIQEVIEMRLNNGIRMENYNHVAFFTTTNNKYFNNNYRMIGLNSNKTQFGNENITTHAEMDACKKIIHFIESKVMKRNRLDLIVLRINKNGNLCESAPCFHCTRFLHSKNIQSRITMNNIYYSNKNGKITSIKFTEWLHQQNKNETKHISTCWKHR